MKIFFASFLSMVLLDLIWIAGFMTDFYKKNLVEFLRFGENGNLLPRVIPTLVVYVAASFLILFFVVPHVKQDLLIHNRFVAALWGALAGVLIYSFYDFTNFALFEKWNFVVSTVDVLWGTLMFYITTIIVTFFL